MSELIETENKSPVRTNDTTIPVTILQLLKAKSEIGSSVLMIDEVPRKYISIVGQIKSVRQDTLHLTYEVDDSTGSILVQVFSPLSTDEAVIEEIEAEPLPLGAYIYVVGRITSIGQQQYENQNGSNNTVQIISAFAVKPVVHFDQIAAHHLEALYVHLLTVRNGLSMISEPEVSDFSVVNSPNMRQTILTPQNYNLKQLDQIEQPLTKEERIVRDIQNLLKACIDQNGITRSNIIKKLNDKYAVNEIMTAIEKMNYDGEIVNTISEEHFAIT